MRDCYSANQSLPFLTDFSKKDRAAADKAISNQEEQRRKAAASRAQKVESLARGVRKKALDLVGAKKFAALREEIERERLAFDDRGEPPEGLKRDYAKQKIAGKRKIDALLNRLGPSRGKVVKVTRAFDGKLEKILPVADDRVVPGYNLRKNLSLWTRLSPLHKFPLPWGGRPPVEDPNDPHRWFLFTPPFFGFLFSDDILTSSNFKADYLLHLHPPSGLVGFEATMDCQDASSWDLAHVVGESQIAFAFVPPAAGIIEVLIDAQSTIGTHQLRIEDEWGFSHAWCGQNNYLMINVLHPNVPEPSLALLSNMFEETDGDDLSADRENLTRGQHYFAHLFSSGPVPAGQTVIITAGTRTFDICRADDMRLNSRSNFQWFINSVEVRISP